MTDNMGHPCRQAIFRLHRPFTVQYFDQHRWLAKPSTRPADTETVRYDVVDYGSVLKGLLERYVNTERHHQRMLYDHAISAPDSAIHEPLLVRTRGRPTRSTRRNLCQFEHLENAFNPKPRRCGSCESLGHNATTCRQAAQAQAVPPAPPALRQIEDIAHFDHVIDDVNAAPSIEL